MEELAAISKRVQDLGRDADVQRAARVLPHLETILALIKNFSIVAEGAVKKAVDSQIEDVKAAAEKKANKVLQKARAGDEAEIANLEEDATTLRTQLHKRQDEYDLLARKHAKTASDLEELRKQPQPTAKQYDNLQDSYRNYINVMAHDRTMLQLAITSRDNEIHRLEHNIGVMHDEFNSNLQIVVSERDAALYHAQNPVNHVVYVSTPASYPNFYQAPGPAEYDAARNGLAVHGADGHPVSPVTFGYYPVYAPASPSYPYQTPQTPQPAAPAAEPEYDVMSESIPGNADDDEEDWVTRDSDSTDGFSIVSEDIDLDEYDGVFPSSDEDDYDLDDLADFDEFFSAATVE